MKMQDLERVLMLARLALLALALIVLFVFALPALAVIVATVALLIRLAMFSPAIRQWLSRNIVTDADRDDDRSDN
ncbi:MAG: hypothetical protein AAFY14_08955 [Pseudomonadota bacterium]